MSLRERNRLATMRAVQTVALRLFAERGFSDVTVEEIAREAEVSASTVYRAFKVKEELVIWDEQDALLEKKLREGLGTGSPLDALEAAFCEAYALDPRAAAQLRRRMVLIDENPRLRDFQIARLDRDRRDLVAAIARAYRRKKGDLELEMTVRASFAALLAAFERWQASPRARLDREIKSCFDALRRILSPT